jgi:hypothetical protein
MDFMRIDFVEKHVAEINHNPQAEAMETAEFSPPLGPVFLPS